MKRVKRLRPVKQRKAKRPPAGNTASADVRGLLESALAHHNKGRLKRAEPIYRQILEADPNHPQAHHLLGLIAHRVGNDKVAQAYIAKAIALKPDYVEAHGNLGNVLRGLGRLDEAAVSYAKALELNADLAEVHSNLGNVLKDLGRLDEAVASYRKALELKPNFAVACNNLGSALMGLGQLDKACASYRDALALKPDFAQAHNNLIHLLRLMAGASSSEIKAAADKFGEMIRSKADPFTDWKGARDPEKRLRVGMVSADFRTNVVARYLESFLGHVDRSRVEFVAYSNFAGEDRTTARLKTQFGLWHKVVGLGDGDLANLVHDDAVDILVDLSGHIGGNRLPMFAYKPAPVQVTWLGLFATTGVPGMDYIFADPYLVPEGEAQYYTEEVWAFAESWFCLSPPDVAAEPGPLPALAKGAVTFGCFNNLVKMTDAVVAVWARVLGAVPGSTLFLKARQLSDGLVKQATLDRFAVHGIGPERLVIEGSSPLAEYFSAYGRVDVALDPYPFHGATTSLDGLWMGVPILTRRGDRVGTHLGESIAHSAGLGDWVADDEDDYVAKAIALTSDLESLAQLRADLRQRMAASSLYDGACFARQFEEALRGMWQKACGQ